MNIAETLFFVSILFFMACNNESDQKHQTVSALVIEDTVSAVPDQVDSLINYQSEIQIKEEVPTLDFIPVEPMRGNKKALMFPLLDNKVKWEDYIEDRLKPKSEDNPDGLDVETLDYGDFGFAQFFSRSVNTFGTGDTFFYYAISENQLIRLQVDSIEAEIMLVRDESKNPFYYGQLIGYSEIELEMVSFLIQTNQKDLIDRTRFFKVKKEDISVLDIKDNTATNSLSVKWANNTYTGNVQESEMVFSETLIIQIENTGNFLLTLWMEDGSGQLCDKHYSLFLLENKQLTKLKANSYHCDI